MALIANGSITIIETDTIKLTNPWASVIEPLVSQLQSAKTSHESPIVFIDDLNIFEIMCPLQSQGREFISDINDLIWSKKVSFSL